MSIIKRKGSPYYWIKFSLNGKRVAESTKTTILREAREYEIKRKKEIIDTTVLGKEVKLSKTWKEAAKRWLEERKEKTTLYQDADKFLWLDSFWKNELICNIDSNKISSIAKRRESDGASPATINRTLALIKSVLNRAHKQWEWISKVPHIEMKKEPAGRIRWLSQDEAAALIKEAPEHTRPAIEFTLETGLRKGTLLKLEWSDIDFENSSFRIPGRKMKSKRNFIVPLSNRAIAIIKSLPRTCNRVFTYEGSPIKEINTRAFKMAVKRAGIKDFKWHDLRHTWASWFVQNGGSLQELQIFGDWSNFSMVLRYGHLCPTNLKSTINKISGRNNSERRRGTKSDTLEI